MAARLAGLVSVADGAAGWDGRVRARVLRVLDGLPGVVEAVRAPVLVASQRAAAAVAGGERGFVDVRARLTGASRWQAAGQVAAAGALAALPVVREAVAGGVVPVGHVQVLARAWQDAGAGLSAAWGTTAGQEKVVELARGVDAREFSRSLAALAAQDDPDGVEDRREAARRARFLTLSHAPDGTFLRGRLDPVAGQVLARALEATGHRPDADRTGDQARADALTALAQHTLTAGHRPSRAVGAAAAIPAPTAPAPDATDPDPIADPDLPDGTPSAPAAHITLLVPAETWHAVRTTQQTRRTRARAQRRADARESRPAGADLTSSSAGAGVRDHDDSAAVPSAVTDDGTTITATELAAALCDCAMTRTVMNAAGLPLDVGRTRRMFTPAQRTAVTARDHRCAWNGCSVPARHCQIHHIAWWHRHTGTTDLTNAVLLCTFHHHEVHRLDLDIERLPPATVPDPVAASPHLDLDADAPPGRGHVASDERRGPPGWAAPSRASLGNPTVPVRYLFRDRRGTPYNAPGDPPPD
ncbi:HNH endonuclease [Cellulomonas gilvus ATCC 13127]|uniref:HNH endonuclease n=1 Tax=Cellulomonas gilvus (strain ATCC 13127 / NRRL B-14078) TaxID=593907 RepID=F8A4J7_CELGA|nr:HNH endonuclease [Cellulomonas gilvus ATCC 13127]